MLHAATAVAEATALAGTLAKEVELGAAGIAAADELDVGDHGAVERELTFHADFFHDLADGDHLADAPTLADDHYALEDLLAFLIAFDDSERNTNGVAHVKLGDIGLEGCGVK